jgi:hypothetical protein
MRALSAPPRAHALPTARAHAHASNRTALTALAPHRSPPHAQAELGPALTHKQRAQHRQLAIRSGAKSS